ncbi:MAG: LamG domain-containing protein [Bacilli bacterium]|nr:LamG domain-containing protein [Bacilli bacterium]
MKQKTFLNEQGFAISGVIYSLLVLFVILLTALLTLLLNQKIILDKTNLSILNGLNGEADVAFRFDYKHVIVANSTKVPGFIFDPLDGVSVVSNKDQRKLPSASITYTSAPSFNGAENGVYKITYTAKYGIYEITEQRMVEVTDAPATYGYAYQGSISTFTAPSKGLYRLEAWGASGGAANSLIGGYGGYAVGVQKLNAGDPLYAAVGGAGASSTTAGGGAAGGYNGGGTVTANSTVNHVAGAGGGATSITTQNRGVLANFSSNKTEVLLVAGGGGGGRDQSNHVADARWGTGGNGGGYKGSQAISNNGTTVSNVAVDNGGTQTTGNAFGAGGNATGHAGGGGGYYGGNAGNQGTYYGVGGAGSGYIGGVISSSGIERAMYSYNTNYTSNTEDTKTYKTTAISSNSVENTAKSGNGYVRITSLVREVQSENLPVYTEEDLYAHYDGYIRGSSGTQWQDLSGNRRNGTLNGFTSSSFTADHGLLFDGVDDRIDTGFTQDALDQNITFSTVVNITALGPYRGLWGYHASNAEKTVWHGITAQSGSTDYMSFAYYAGGGTYATVPVYSNAILNKKVQITVTMQGGMGLKIYINGKLYGHSESAGVIVPYEGANFYIGQSHPATDRYFKGTMYNFMIYKKVLDEKEIEDNYKIDAERFGL